MSLFDVFRRKKVKKEISLVVSDKIPNEIYKKMKKLKDMSFKYGEIEFFSKETIDEAQAGFRFIPPTNEIINDWAGDEYVIIGYDSTAGCGPDPLIMKTDDEKYPIYWLMTDGGDWNNPEKIANSLDDYIVIMSIIKGYEKELEDSTLTETQYNNIINEIGKITNNRYMSFWGLLLKLSFEDE